MKHKLTLVLLSFFLGVQCMVAQQMKVTGVVINEDDGEPVIGASIVVKGTTIGTITDLDGKFELETQKDAKLIISYVGLRTQETTAQQNMRIVLSSDSQAIDEVVVVAYGTAKKSSFTGSASTVGAALMDKRPLSNALSALEGNTSGVQMTSSIGQPGEAAKVTIRGFGSVNADNAPLYVVDGAIFSGDISSISPSDIESMTILKDAASTSLYGSSAGNGVVLITTKKGSSSSGAGVTLSISQGWSSRAYNDYAKVGVYDYYPLQWQMLRNANMSLGQSATDAAANASKDIINKLKYNPFVGIANDAIVGTDGLLNPSASALKWGEDLDWEDAAYRTGHRQEYNVSYNTKTEKSDTYASIGYLNDKGYMIKTDFERYNARLNYNIYPVKWFKSGLNLGLSRTNSNYSTSTSSNSAGYGNLSRFIRSMAPIYPVHKHDIETGAYLDKEGNVVTDPALYTYDYEGARISSNGRDGIAEALWNDRLMSTTNSSARTYVTITPIEGLNLTVNYAFDNRFSKDNRWGNFWSFGASWRISQEDFMENLTWVDNLKLRASYGETGNDAIYYTDDDTQQDYYPYQTLYNLGINNGLEAGLYFPTMANNNLKWETQVSTDVALEFGLFGRLNGTVEFFRKASRDLLFNVSQPLSSGVEKIVQNIGKVRNQGVEIDLNYQVLKSKDWKLSVGANATFINNKVTRLPDANRKDGIIKDSKKLMEGHSIYEFWLRQWWGVNPDNGDGLYIFDAENNTDANGNIKDAVKKTLVEKDGQVLTNSYSYAKYDFSGSAVPKVYGGFNINLSYKAFDLSTVFSYSLGGKVLDSSYRGLMDVGEFGYAMSPDLHNAWTTPGQITDVPRLDNNSGHATSIGQSYSTRWLTNANYLNLRTVTLAYNLPKSILNVINIKSARVNVSAENLFMLKARQGLNPQANYAGVSYNEYMPAKNFTIGLNVSF